MSGSATNRSKFPIEGLIALLGGVVGAQLSANVTMDDSYGNINAWAPTSADREITLPDPADCTDVPFLISNIGAGTYNLIIKYDGSTVATVYGGEFAVFIPVGGVWQVVFSAPSRSSSGGAQRLAENALAVSTEVTANGLAQNTAHGLSRTPVWAVALFSSLPAGLAAGAAAGAVTYDATNLTVTVTPSGAKYRIIYF